MWKKIENKKDKINYISVFLILFIAVITHKNWFFSFDPITSGDWWFYDTESIKEWFSFPYVWTTQQNLGIFDISMSFYGFKILFGFFALLGIPYSLSERILFFWPVAVISVVGMYYFSNRLFNNSLISFFASILYSLNTYSLTIETGHLTVAMAYSLAPLILAFFMDSLNKDSVISAVVTGFLFSIAFIYEPRISYIIVLISLLYLFIEFIYKQITKKTLIVVMIPFTIVFLIHSYWIFPYIFGGSSGLGKILPADPWISWMTILNSFNLQHPFWTGEAPIDFMVQPISSFLFALPLIAFSSLLIKNKRNEKIILYFALLGIIGIFLVKQENPPFGQMYTWLFHNFPGFNMFREASKFYIFITLSYSILVGYTINEMYNKISKHSRTPTLKYAFITACLILILFTAKPAFTNELGKTFENRVAPQEYIQLKDFLHNQNEYFRTLWYPTKQRFGYFSNNHPMIAGIELFFGDTPLNKFMPPNPTWTSLPDNRTLNNLLDILSVKNVVIPFDSENDIYRYYLPKNEFVKNMDNLNWLDNINFSENIRVYENDGYMGHFFGIYNNNKTILEDWSNVKYFDEMERTNIEYEMLNPTKYILKINTTEPFTLAFSEKYDPNWVAIVSGNEIKSYPLFSIINGFEISDIGNYELTVEYKLQSYVYIGLIFSVLTIILCITYLSKNQNKRLNSIHEIDKGIR